MQHQLVIKDKKESKAVLQGLVLVLTLLNTVICYLKVNKL